MTDKLMATMVLGLLWLMSPMTAAIDLDANFHSLDIKDACTIMIDDGQLLPTRDVAIQIQASSEWRSCRNEHLSRGFTSENIWLRFDFNNTTGSDAHVFLSLLPSWLHRLTLFTFEQDSLVKEDYQGTYFPFDSRIIPAPNYILPIDVLAGQQLTLLVHTESQLSTLIGGEITTNEQMLNSIIGINFLNGVIVGSISLIGLYNLFIYFSIRDKNYLYYFFYSASMIYMLSILYGFGYQIFWPASPKFNAFSEVASLPVCAIFMAVFIRSFLNLKHVSVTMDYINLFYIYASIFVLFLALFPQYHQKISVWSGILSNSGAPIIFFSGLLALIKGQKSAMYFLIAWVCSMFTMGLLGLMFTGYMEFNFELYYLFGFSILLEMALLSLALANKINLLQEERVAADLAALNAEIEYSKGLEAAAAQLENKVHIRTFDLAQEKKRAEVMARTDSLTGLNNRRAFFECGERIFQENIGTKSLLSVAMIDIDCFKNINDNHGHHVGDVAITAVALSLLPAFAFNSVVGRIGGEEFGVIIKGVTAEQAMVVAEQARGYVAGLKIPVDDSTFIDVSVSIGIAEYTETDQSIDEALVRADIALYQAKAEGRNRTVFYEQ